MARKSILSLLQSYPIFGTDTQSSAKPPPWAIRCRGFAAKTFQR
jgi:hypothetical protein